MSRFASKTSALYVTETEITPTKPPAGVEYIAIKSVLSIGEQNLLEAAMMRVRASASAKKAKKGAQVTPDLNLELRMGEYLNLLERLFVIDWYLLDDSKQPVPFDEDKVLELSSDDPLVDRALAEAARRNPTQRSFRMTVLGGSTS